LRRKGAPISFMRPSYPISVLQLCKAYLPKYAKFSKFQLLCRQDSLQCRVRGGARSLELTVPPKLSPLIGKNTEEFVGFARELDSFSPGLCISPANELF